MKTDGFLEAGRRLSAWRAFVRDAGTTADVIKGAGAKRPKQSTRFAIFREVFGPHERLGVGTPDWDVDQGLRVGGAEAAGVSAADPLAVVRAAPSLRSESGTTLLVLVNFHRFLQSAEVVQALARQIVDGKRTRTFFVVLAPVVRIPVELEKLFAVVEHELPDREQLAEIARGVATEPEELPSGPTFEQVLDAAAGLTRYEAEAAFSLGLVRAGRLAAEPLWEQKAQLLRKSGTLALYRGGADFASLGGLSALKAFSKRALLRRGNRDVQVRARARCCSRLPAAASRSSARRSAPKWGGPC